MKKKITIGVGVALLALIIVLICIFAIMPDANLKNMLDMIDRQEAIVIEVPEPISEEQGTTIEYEWTELASLTTYPEFRTTFDDTFNIVPYGTGGKAGTVYIDLSGNQTNNSTLYNALMNQKFAEAWNNTDNLKKIISAVKDTYVDIDSDTEALTAALNAYFNLTSDAEPNYYNGNSTLTRGEYLGMLYRASTPVEDLTDKAGLTESIEDTDTALFASQIADKSYLTTADSSLNTSTFNSTITRAEAIYTIVQQYYSDEYKSVTGKENSYSDAKNGGNIAEKAGFITKDKKTGEVTEKKYWKSYELSYSMQNEAKGMPTDLYKALVVAKNHNLITGDESRWSDGLTKTEAINLITSVYEDLAETNGYLNNAERGNATGETVTDATVVEDAGGSGEVLSVFNNKDIYSEEVLGALSMYDFFADSTSDEIKTYIEENEDMQELLEYYDSDTIDKALNSMVDLQGKTLYEMNHPSTSTSSTASSNGNNQSGSAKNNQSNSSNQNSSTSNTTNENANTNEDNWTPPAKSINNAEDGFAGVIDNGDGTITSSDGTFTMSDGSNFGGGDHTIPDGFDADAFMNQ